MPVPAPRRSAPLLTVAALVAAAPGCVGGDPRGSATLDGAAPRALESAAGLRDPDDLYLAGEFRRARDAYRRLVSPRVTSLARASALYGLARSEYALGRIGEARAATEDLLEFLGRSKEHSGPAGPPGMGLVDPEELRAYALTLLSDLALAQRRPAEAIALLDRLRREGLHGRAGSSDEMLFREAAALEAGGRTREARRAFRRLAASWPEGPLAREALARAEKAARPVYESRAGVFETRPSAEALARALRSRGLGARVEVHLGGAGRRFIVSLGRFARREDAEEARGRAEAEGFRADISVRTTP